ncbi:MAG: DUF86 domain-containing protein, partial [Leptolyngbya sp. SIO4C1]|nr:DUF86 domain-containing protein [Leptolyngbya sp. SIO4C1]
SELNDYLADFDKQLIVERLLQLLVEAASDINAYLLVEIHGRTPESYFDSFIEAGRRKILDLEFAQELAQASGLRNRLVHQYEEIDNSIVFQAIQEALNQFPAYIRQIMTYLDALEAGNDTKS